MNNFFKTLIEPDWDDTPKKSEIIQAANLIQIGEFQLIQLAYKAWYEKDLTEEEIKKIFNEYMVSGIIPIWVTYYAADIIKLDKYLSVREFTDVLRFSRVNFKDNLFLDL